MDDAKTFKYGYRNVIVVKKMTFPNDKVLTIELSGKQISGRTISLSIDYEDVLSADSFNPYTVGGGIMRIRNEELGVRNWLVHTLLVVICFMASMTPAMAQQNSDRISLGFGCLYERGLDVTLSYEYETKYHNAWEYFANGYIKWNECASVRSCLS